MRHIRKLWCDEVIKKVIAYPELSFSEIGDKWFGISGNYVSQIARRAGIYRGNGYQKKKAI